MIAGGWPEWPSWPVGYCQSTVTVFVSTGATMGDVCPSCGQYLANHENLFSRMLQEMNSLMDRLATVAQLPRPWIQPAWQWPPHCIGVAVGIVSARMRRISTASSRSQVARQKRRAWLQALA